MDLRIDILIPPGIRSDRIDLLEKVDQTGSISAAAFALGIAYPQAWHRLADLNRHFREPLVVRYSGGRRGGGAVLTATGRDVVATFRAIENRARSAASKDLEALAHLMVAPPSSDEDVARSASPSRGGGQTDPTGADGDVLSVGGGAPST